MLKGLRALLGLMLWGVLLLGLTRLETSGLPRHQIASEQPDAGTNAEKCEERDFWGRSVCDPVAGFTGVLALFTGALLVVALVQIGFLVRADRGANKMAGIAEKQLGISGLQTDLLTMQKEIARQEFWLTTGLNWK